MRNIREGVDVLFNDVGAKKRGAFVYAIVFAYDEFVEL